MSSQEWIRIYLDREKLSGVYHQASKGKKGKILDFIKKFDLELVFAKLPLKELIGDKTIDGMIDTISKQGRYYSVSKFVNLLLEPNGISKGQLTSIEARKDMEEDITIFSPTGKVFPILKAGSYLIYRPPFKKTILFDGQYHEAYVVDIVSKPGNYDMVKVLIKEHDRLDVPKMLVNWDNFHARVIGIVGNAPSYNCRIRGSPPSYSLTKTNRAIYAMAIEVCPPKNIELVERLGLWRSWG